MYSVRRWAVRRARLFERVYTLFEPLLIRLDPLWSIIGYGRIEKPMRVIEGSIKGFLFDCQMCGQCALGDTGMSCPMNCPKNLRNGPCGGVRANGHCEVKPYMACVWVDAWSGSQRMRGADRIHVIQDPIDSQLRSTSSWMNVARRFARERRPDSTSVRKPHPTNTGDTEVSK